MSATMHQETNGHLEGIDQTDIYVTSDSSFWAAMLSKEIYPFKVSLTENAIQVTYEMKSVSMWIPEVSNGSTPISERDALASIIIWKAIIGAMKMLSRYYIDLKLASTDPGEREKILAHTTDQYLVWVLSFRGIVPSQVLSRGRDTSFEFGMDKIESLKIFLFIPYTGTMQNYGSMKTIWRQAKAFRDMIQ
jgi:hypothetical protein